MSAGTGTVKRASVKGDAAAGVRAHPSYDQPGKFYAIEAASKRRVWSGYHSAGEIALEAKRRGVKFLGVVLVKGAGSGKGYNAASVAAAVAKLGTVKANAAKRRK